MFKNIINILEPLYPTALQNITPSQSQDLLDALSHAPPNLQLLFDKISKLPSIRMHCQDSIATIEIPPSQDRLVIRTPSEIMGFQIDKTDTQSLYTLFYGENLQVPEDLHQCPIYIIDSQITVDLKNQFIPDIYQIFLTLGLIDKCLSL